MIYSFAANLCKNITKIITLENVSKLKSIVSSYDNLLFVGNGGSNAIISHISVDYTKFLKKKCHPFTDSSLLTAYANDYGLENCFVEFIKSYYEKNTTVVVIISSSGNSLNVVNTVEYCEKNKIPYILLTGFSENNKAKSISINSLLNIWVNSNSYGIVELIHESFLHSVVDN